MHLLQLLLMAAHVAGLVDDVLPWTCGGLQADPAVRAAATTAAVAARGCRACLVHPYTQVNILHDAQAGIKTTDSLEISFATEQGLITCVNNEVQH
jgi:hypothetical protein